MSGLNVLPSHSALRLLQILDHSLHCSDFSEHFYPEPENDHPLPFPFKHPSTYLQEAHDLAFSVKLTFSDVAEPLCSKSSGPPTTTIHGCTVSFIMLTGAVPAFLAG